MDSEEQKLLERTGVNVHDLEMGSTATATTDAGAEADDEWEPDNKKKKVAHDERPKTIHASTLLNQSLEAQAEKQGEMLRYLNLSHRSEVTYITTLLEESSKKGHLSFNYSQDVWSDWFKEKTQADPVKEHAMLNGLQRYLHRKGYETVVTIPYRNPDQDRYFMHISWKRSNRFMGFEHLDCTYNRMMNYMALVAFFVYTMLSIGTIMLYIIYHVFSRG